MSYEREVMPFVVKNDSPATRPTGKLSLQFCGYRHLWRRLSAGGGKTWALLLECLRHIANPRFSAVVFRRTYPMINSPGGLWDASLALYPLLGGTPKNTLKEWRFPAGSKVAFRHLKLESDRLAWQGAEIPLICWDELTHFSEGQFWYLLSRNRSTCGIRPYVRATTNPDADSWVRSLLSWWLTDDGLPDLSRAGVVRYFVRDGGDLIWLDEPAPNSKSITFIPASVYDNAALLRTDPGYLANLQALPLVERDRLLGGNWNVKATAGKVYRAEWFSILDAAPKVGTIVRFWDFASRLADFRGDDPDWTASVKMLLTPEKRAVVLDCIAVRETPAGVDRLVLQTAHLDGAGVATRWYQDPGQAGVYQSHKLRQLLAGFDASGVFDPLDKYTRARPLSRAAEFGEVSLAPGAWHQDFLAQMSGFPDMRHDDIPDAAAGAYNHLTGLNLRQVKTSYFSG
jgi:predicted phage terminase large subunit-like protein